MAKNRLVDDLAHRKQHTQRVRSDPSFSSSPQMCEIRLPVNAENVTDVDEELIQLLFTYKEKILKNRDNQWEDKVKEMQSESGPSEEAKELVSFVYDHMDEFEEVLSEEESNELESLMMNVQ